VGLKQSPQVVTYLLQEEQTRCKLGYVKVLEAQQEKKVAAEAQRWPIKHSQPPTSFRQAVNAQLFTLSTFFSSQLQLFHSTSTTAF